MMKIKKNKIVFALMLFCIVLFIGAYTMIVLEDNEVPTIDNNQIPVPELKDKQKSYNSKLDALNAIKEERLVDAPSVYDERLLDSMGIYDPELLDKEKMRIVDSIYRNGRIDYTTQSYRKIEPINFKVEEQPKTVTVQPEIKSIVSAKELGLEHQLFFASNPLKSEDLNIRNTDATIHVVVDGEQTVKAHHRLRMRLLHDAYINNSIIPRNTLVYGFISFQPNRALIKIENINHQASKLKAFDYQDGSEGIYVENSFRADATREVVDDLVQDINVAGVPQVNGVKKIFQRNNRNVKVTISNNYKLILKVSKRH